MKKWPPNVNNTGYCGPYPVNDIHLARSRLIRCLMPPHSSGLARVLPKIGIDSCFGPGLVPPPPQPLPNGLTTSDSYSLAPDKTPETSPLSVTKSASFATCPAVPVSNWTPVRISRSVSVDDTRQDNVNQSEHGTTCTRECHADNVSVTKRRYSELSSTDDVTVKKARDNGALMTSKNRGQADASGSQANVSRVHGEPLSPTKLPPSHVYKCDYCRVTATSDTEITNHLTRSRHASASEYIISTAGDGSKTGPELQAVERMLAVSNPDRTNCAALVIACPECRSIFDDIFTCATHNKYEHGESDGCYAVCPVIHSEKVEVNVTCCAVCQQRFTDHNDLVEHYAALPGHSPTPQSTDSRVFLVQTCPACKRTFNDDFLDCVIHMAEDHGTVTWVEVRHVMLPQRRERLPPFSSNRQSVGGLRDEATVLSRLQNCFEQNAINARLEQIQKILAGAA